MTPLNALDRPPWLPESTWPWPRHTIDTEAGRIAVTDVGSGRTVLLSHVGMWSFVWRDLIRELAPHYRVVTFDAPGTGRSERPSSPVTLEGGALAIGTLIDTLDLDDITLVMHDIGGPTALAAAATRAGRVSRLVAINTFAWRPAGAVFRGMLATMGSAPVRETDALTGLLPAAASTRFGAGRHWPAEDRRVFRAGFDAGARRAIHRYLGGARHADPLFARAEAALAGPLADRPALTVFGQRNDPLGLQDRWRELFPYGTHHVVPRGNHFPMCDAPAQIADWLGDVHRGGAASAAP